MHLYETLCLSGNLHKFTTETLRTHRNTKHYSRCILEQIE